MCGSLLTFEHLVDGKKCHIAHIIIQGTQMAVYHNEITKEFLSPNLINQHPIFKERSSQSREPKSTNAQIISNPVEEVNGGFEKFFIFLFIQSFHLGFGGPTEDRTRDPVIKSHMLYLLSYWSICALSFIKDQSCFGYDWFHLKPFISSQHT